MSEFNLSLKIEGLYNPKYADECSPDLESYVPALEKILKEFIRRLKAEFPINCREHHKFHNKIDELAGDKLI